MCASSSTIDHTPVVVNAYTGPDVSSWRRVKLRGRTDTDGVYVDGEDQETADEAVKIIELYQKRPSSYARDFH